MAAPSHSKLLVEGRGDLHVVNHLLKQHGFGPPFKIEDKEGFNRLRKSIYAEVNAPDRSVLGILADANDNINSRWQSISGALSRAGCQVPNKPAREGNVFSGPRGVSVGVWLMPNNQRSGELEDFIHDMIPKNDPVLPRAKRFIDDIPEADRKFRNDKTTRAYVHAWLTTREKPRPMGTAISAGDLNHNVAVANAFVSWLRKLFNF